MARQQGVRRQNHDFTWSLTPHSCFRGCCDGVATIWRARSGQHRNVERAAVRQLVSQQDNVDAAHAVAMQQARLTEVLGLTVDDTARRTIGCPSASNESGITALASQQRVEAVAVNPHPPSLHQQRMEHVAALVEMGFERGASLHQLISHQDDFSSALNALLLMPDHALRMQQARLTEGTGLTDDNTARRTIGWPSAPSQSGMTAVASETRASTSKGDAESEDHTCCVCLEELANACFVPCGHINACMNCVRKLTPKRCPICRTEFEGVVKAMIKQKREASRRESDRRQTKPREGNLAQIQHTPTRGAHLSQIQTTPTSSRILAGIALRAPRMKFGVLLRILAVICLRRFVGLPSWFRRR